MAFCKFCGKELGEDNKCTCAEFQDEERNADIFVRAVEPSVEKPIKRGGALKYIIVALIILLVGFIAVWIIISANSYKNPIKTLTKGIRKADSSRVIESMYTETTVAELRLQAKENGLNWEEYLKQHNKTIESSNNRLGIKHLKLDIVAKERLSGSNLTKVEQFYSDNYSLKVKKAYRIEVEFTYKLNGEKSRRKGWLCVAKLKGEGWKFCPQKSDDNFDFIDAVIDFE